MPYTYKKEGDKYVVYKKEGGERVGSTAGNKEALKKYLAALHMHANENINEFYAGFAVDEINKGDVFSSDSKNPNLKKFKFLGFNNDGDLRFQSITDPSAKFLFDRQNAETWIVDGKIKLDKSSNPDLKNHIKSLQKETMTSTPVKEQSEFASLQVGDVMTSKTTGLDFKVIKKTNDNATIQCLSQPENKFPVDKEFLENLLIKGKMEVKGKSKNEAVAQTANDLERNARRVLGSASPIQVHNVIAKALKNKKNVSFNPKMPHYVMLDGIPHKMVNGELVPLKKKVAEKIMAELTQSAKTNTAAGIDTQIAKLQTQIAMLQKKKEDMAKQPTSVTESLWEDFKKALIQEADADPKKKNSADGNADPNPADVPTPEDSGSDTTDAPEKKEPNQGGTQVKFNLSKVRSYNTYPVTTNTGIITSATKDGLVVNVNGNEIAVNLEDLL